MPIEGPWNSDVKLIRACFTEAGFYNLSMQEKYFETVILATTPYGLISATLKGSGPSKSCWMQLNPLIEENVLLIKLKEFLAVLRSDWFIICHSILLEVRQRVPMANQIQYYHSDILPDFATRCLAVQYRNEGHWKLFFMTDVIQCVSHENEIHIPLDEPDVIDRVVAVVQKMTEQVGG